MQEGVLLCRWEVPWCFFTLTGPNRSKQELRLALPVAVVRSHKRMCVSAQVPPELVGDVGMAGVKGIQGPQGASEQLQCMVRP